MAPRITAHCVSAPVRVERGPCEALIDQPTNLHCALHFHLPGSVSVWRLEPVLRAAVGRKADISCRGSWRAVLVLGRAAVRAMVRLQSRIVARPSFQHRDALAVYRSMELLRGGLRRSALAADRMN